MMFDLTNTPFAEAPERSRLPTEGELFALMVALVLATWCTSPEHEDHVLTLTDENVDSVASLLERPLAGLVGELGSKREFRASLRQFIGLNVRVGDVCNPIFP